MTKMSPYQSFIAISRYSRWMEEVQRRETWEESVNRYLDFMSNHVKENYNYDPSDYMELLTDNLTNLKAFGSMRALMTAGPALERSNIAGYNCFAGTEKYLTPTGLKSFIETVGTTQTVINGKGRWVRARIHSFGEQKLAEITFKPSRKTNIRHKVRATPDHRWITNNRGEVTDLKVGDRVSFVPAQSYDTIPEAFIQGFGFGDGTIDTRGRAKVRLCGDKDAQWLSVFQEYGHASIMSPPSYHGDTVVVYHKGYFEDWKKLPVGMPAEWLASWLEGYLCADGHLNPVQPGLSSQSREAIEFVKEIAPLAGYIVTGDNISSVMETNLGTRKNPLNKLTLRRTGEFTVTSIESLDEIEEVYCAVVPDGQDFVLAHGIHTGNCAYLPMDSVEAFDELLYILMNGTGVGFSVENRYVEQLPTVKAGDPATWYEPVHVYVEDSKEGWAEALRDVVSALYLGREVDWDVSAVRPSGSRLKTFGGRSSGPAPLVELFEFVTRKFGRAKGRKLTSLEVFDIVCKIASVVVVGGVRRSALIGLTDLDDTELVNAKSGQWWEEHPYRALCNISAVYNHRPTQSEFMGEWKNIYDSNSGERGIFNREASRNQAAKYGNRSTDIAYGTNPCSEIILRPYQFCNLSTVVIEPEDTLGQVKDKIRAATVFGTWQSTLTDFKYLRPIWRENTEEERLLGVSMTGQLGHPILNGSQGKIALEYWLNTLRMHARVVNKALSQQMGINSSAAVTCVKPEGTTSQLSNSASGMHPWHSEYYIRRVRGDKKDPLTRLMTDFGVPVEEDVTNPDATAVFSFPVKAPDKALTRSDLGAVEHLDLWLSYQRHFTDHKPSVTVTVREDEWLPTAAWVWKHFDELSGVAFLPYADHVYQQAPYESIDKDQYDELVSRMPAEIPWEELSWYELYDQTVGSQTLACSASGGCETVDLV